MLKRKRYKIKHSIKNDLKFVIINFMHNLKVVKAKAKTKYLKQLKAKPQDKNEIRYSTKRMVTQEQMDKVVRDGFVCLETWEVIK